MVSDKLPYRIRASTPAVDDIPSKVWSFTPDRRLTNLADIRAALIDFIPDMLTKADFDIKLPDARAARIDSIVGMSEEGSGTLTADGTVQTVVDKTSTKPFMCQLLLNTKNMAAADQIQIIEKFKVLSGGSIQRFTTTNVTGEQEEPVLIFAPKYGVREYNVTLQQLFGTYRAFDWSLIVMESA